RSRRREFTAPSRWAQPPAACRRQAGRVASLARSRARHLLLARQSLERSRRHAPQIHLPRPRRQRAALRFIERPTRAARSLRRSRRRTHPPPVAISHDRALFAAGRPLGERWQTRRARERPRPLPKLSRVTQASLPAIFRDASREFLLAWVNQCEPVSVIITR